MPLPRVSGPIRVILWATALAAGLGAAYAERRLLQGGGQALAISGLARGAVTGGLIAGILTTFDALVMDGPIGAPLRRTPFAVHVAVRTVIYLGGILFCLKFCSVL